MNAETAKQLSGYDDALEGERMRRGLAMFLSFGFLASLCHAETRWCSITGHGPSDALTYPAIARAARISGVVLSRVIYSPAGQVVNVEEISGPVLLSRWTAGQLKKWTVKTDAHGDELCETLVIADFRLYEPSEPAPVRPTEKTVPSIFRVSVDSQIAYIDGDDQISSIPTSPLRIFWRGLVGIFKRQD